MFFFEDQAEQEQGGGNNDFVIGTTYVVSSVGSHNWEQTFILADTIPIEWPVFYYSGNGDGVFTDPVITGGYGAKLNTNSGVYYTIPQQYFSVAGGNDNLDAFINIFLAQVGESVNGSSVTLTLVSKTLP